MQLPQPSSSDKELRPVEETLLGLIGSKSIAVLLILVFSVTYYAFRSNTLIGDGLRHLPALRTISEDVPPVFKPKPWLEVYRSHFDRVVVHNHFLYALTMRAAFSLQQKVGIAGDAIIAMQAVNAISAAIAGGLFFLLALRIGVPIWISLAVTVGVCLSPAYLLAATNLAEVGLALPFFVGTLLVLSDHELLDPSAVAAGVLAGLAAIMYLLAGSLIPSIVLALFALSFRSRSAFRTLVLFLSSSALVFLGLWFGVLFLSGVHSPKDLVRSIVTLPAQGTYGGFRLGSLVATPVGLTEAFIHVLPDDFRGLRLLYEQKPLISVYVGILSLIACICLVRVIYTLFRSGKFRELLFLTSLLTFLIVEAACIEWDPYYQKLQLFALILFWVMAAAGFTSQQDSKSQKWLLLLLVAVAASSGLAVLRRNVQPSQPRENAKALHSIVGSGVLITGWSSDVAHMWLYSNGENNIPLPDFAMARNLEASRVMGDLQSIMEQTIAQGRNVYFYGLFDDDDADLTNIYEIRYRLAGFVPYLRCLQRKARPVAYFEQPGGKKLALYAYAQ